MDQDDSNSNPGGPRFRFTITTLLVGTTIVALAIALAWTQFEVAQLKTAIAPQDTLTVEEVAASVENYASAHPFPVQIRDVRYSPERDAYKILFEFTNTSDKQRYVTNLTLVGDGWGVYSGKITNPDFLAPLNKTELPVYAVRPSAPSRRR